MLGRPEIPSTSSDTLRNLPPCRAGALPAAHLASAVLPGHHRHAGICVVSQIAAEDLTFAANFIQSRTFRAFEAYFVSTLVYLLLAILLRQVLLLAGTMIFPRRAQQ